MGINQGKLNLLPREDQAVVGYERTARFLMLFHGVVSLLLIIGMILLLPTYFFIYFQHAGVLRQIEAEKDYLKTQHTDETEHEIQETNKKLFVLFQRGFSKQSPITPLLFSVVEQAQNAVSLQQFTYHKDEKKIELRGTSGTRDEFLSFVNRLRNYPRFTHIDSPVSNILKERGNKFIVTVSLADGQ